MSIRQLTSAIHNIKFPVLVFLSTVVICLTMRQAQAETIVPFYQPAAESRYLTGNWLADQWRAYKKCSEQVRPESTDCTNSIMYTTYLEGVHDGFWGLGPAGITLGQVAAIVGRYLDAHPEEWLKNAALLTGKALREAFKPDRYDFVFLTGKDLIELLRKAQKCTENPKDEGCTSNLVIDAIQYPRGVHDALLVQERLPNCEDQDCNAGDIRKIVGKYLEKHPEKWKMNGAQSVMEALREAFPPKK